MRTPLLAPILLLTATIYTQSPQSELSASPNLRIVKQTAPVYPPIAKAAHVSGQVELQIEIAEDGRVISANAVSGPPMLVSSAQECVKQWVYEPVLIDGKPVSTSTTVTIRFDLPAPVNPDDKEIASRFFPLDRACIKAVSSNNDSDEQADACKQAADVAQTFSDQERFIERRSAFVYASTALQRDKRLSESLEYANKAVAVVAQGHDDGSGSSAAYGVRAQAEALLGDLTAASDDLSEAKDFQRKAIVNTGGISDDFVKHQYVPVLKRMLNFHAQILSALEKSDESAAKAAEAAKL